MADFSEVIDMLRNGEGGKAWHKLGDMLHKPKGGAHTNDDSGNNGPVPPPPPPPNVDPNG